MTKKAELRVGLVGCGRIAQKRHIPILAKTRKIRLVAAADTNADVLSRVTARYDIGSAYTHHRALLEDSAVDVVVVCTPPGHHFEPARDALLSGRHVFIESPLCLSEAHSDELVNLAKSTNCIATVGLNLRHHILIQRAKACIASGMIGPVQSITASLSTPSRGLRGDVLPQWRQADTLEGSVFGEVAIQYFDVWRLLSGLEFDEVSVYSSRIGGPVSMTATLRKVEQPQSEPVVVAATFSEYAGDNSEIRVIGQHGTIRLSLYRFDGFSFCHAMEQPGSVKQHFAAIAESVRSLPQGLRNLAGGGQYGITFKTQMQSFVDACMGGEPPAVSVTDGRAATLASLAAFQSMTSGKSVILKQPV